MRPAKKSTSITKANAATKAEAPRKKTAASAKKASPAKAVPQITVTVKDIAAALAEAHNFSRKLAEAVLVDFMALTTQHLKQGNKIRLNGLGILRVEQRAARAGRNPSTGEPMQIKASKKVTFRASKELKQKI